MEHSDTRSQTAGDIHTLAYISVWLYLCYYCADVKTESGNVGMVNREVKSEPVPNFVSVGEAVVCSDIVRC